MNLYYLKTLMSVFCVLMISQTTVGRYTHSWDTIDTHDPIDGPQPPLIIADPENSIVEQNHVNRPQRILKLHDWVKVNIETEHRGMSPGNSYELKCQASGSPAPKIYWVRGQDSKAAINEVMEENVEYHELPPVGYEIGTVVSKHVIDCVSNKDVGPIHCIAVSRDRTDVQSSFIYLNATTNSDSNELCNPTQAPTITKYITTLFSLHGTTIVLPCVARGISRLHILWLTNNGVVVNSNMSPHYQVLDDGSLLINNLQWEDMGIFTCKAQSLYGEDRINTFVYPMKPGTRE